MGRPKPLSFICGGFSLFLVFSSKQHNFYSKSMCINVHSVYVTGIRTHCLSNMSSLRPGLIKSLMLIAPHVFRSFDPTENIFRVRPGPCLRTSKERLLQERMRSQPIRWWPCGTFGQAQTSLRYFFSKYIYNKALLKDQCLAHWFWI